MSSQRKKGAILSYIFMAVEVLSGLFLTPFLIRSFGQAEYGVYSLVNTITAYMYLLDLGIGNSIIRYMSKFRVNNDIESQKSLMALTLIFYITVGAVIIAIGWILRENFANIFNKGLTKEEISRAKIMFGVTILNAAATLIIAPFGNTIIAFEKFTFSKIADIIKVILRVTILIIILKLGGKGIAIISLNFAMTVCFGIITILYNIFVIKIVPSIKKINKQFVTEIFSYSFIIFIQMIAAQINSMADQILMGIMVSTASVLIGVYAIGAQISSYLQRFATSINNLLMPGVVHMIETKKDTKYIENEMVKIGRIVFMFIAMIYAVFLVFGDDFIELWAGKENYQAYYVGVIIMLPMPLILAQRIGGQILWALNRHKMQAILEIMVALFNIVFTAIMIKWNPLLGASIATCIAYFVGNIVVQNIVFTRCIGINMKSYYHSLFKGIVPSLSVILCVGIVEKVLLQSVGWIGFVTHCIIMVFSYFIMMYFKGINRYEKQMIKDVITKVIR